MKRKLFRALAVILCLSLASLSLALAVTVRSKAETEEVLARGRDGMANHIAERLHRHAWSYEEFQSQSEYFSRSGTASELDLILEEWDLWEWFLSEKDQKSTGSVLIHLQPLLQSYSLLMQTMEAVGPTEELKQIYQRLQSRFELLFHWELTEGVGYANTDLLVQRFLAIQEEDRRQDPKYQIDLYQHEVYDICMKTQGIVPAEKPTS